MSVRAAVLPLQGAQAESQLCVTGFAAGVFFALRSIFVLVSARWLHAGSEAGVLFTFALSFCLLSTIGLQAIGSSSYRLSDTLRIKPVRWVLAYLCFSGLSLLWGRSASPLSSAAYWLLLATDAVIVWLLVRGHSGPAVLPSLLYGFIAASCLIACVAWIMPSAADLRLGDLEYFNTNQIANLCSLSVLLLPYIRRSASISSSMVAAFLTITLLRSLSKATLAAFVVAQTYRMFCDRAITRTRKFLVILAACGVTLVFSGLIESYLDEYTATGNQAESLTGRTAIWAWALDASVQHPCIGNGFDAMWKVAPPFGGEMFEARHAENELLQQFFAFGVFGIVLMVGTYASLYSHARRSIVPTHRHALIALILFVLVRGLAEAEPFDLLLPLWLIISLSVLVQSRYASRSPVPVPPSTNPICVREA